MIQSSTPSASTTTANDKEVNMATSVDASLRHDSEDATEEDENVFIDVETYSEEDEDEDEDEEEEDDEGGHQDTKRNSAMLDRRQVLPARDRALKHCENCRNHGKQQLVSGHFNCAHAACACEKCVKSRWKRERARQRVQSYRRSIAAAAKEHDVLSSPANAPAPLASSADMETEVVSAASIDSAQVASTATTPSKPRSAAVKQKRVRSYKRKHPDTDDDKVREKVADILKAAASANVEEPMARLAKSQQNKSSSQRIRHAFSEKGDSLEVEEAVRIDDGYEVRSASVDPLHEEIDVVTVDTYCEQASRMIAQIAGSFEIDADSHRQPHSTEVEMLGSGGLASTRQPTFGELSTSMPTPFSQLLDECSKRVGEMPSGINVSESSCATSNQRNDVMADDSAAASTSWAPGNARAADGNVEHTPPFGASRRVRASQKEQRLVLSTVLPLPSASRDVYLAAADLSRDYERLYLAAAAADSAAFPSSMAELRKRWSAYVARLERNRRVNDYDDSECPSERLRLGPDASPTCVILAELLLQRRAPDNVRALLVSQATRRAAAATHAATRVTAASRAAAASRAQRKQTTKRPKASVGVTASDVAEKRKSEAAAGGQNHQQLQEQLVAFLEKQQRKQQITTISPLTGHCGNDYGVPHSNQSIRSAMLAPITSSQQSRLT